MRGNRKGDPPKKKVVLRRKVGPDRTVITEKEIVDNDYELPVIHGPKNVEVDIDEVKAVPTKVRVTDHVSLSPEMAQAWYELSRTGKRSSDDPKIIYGPENVPAKESDLFDYRSVTPTKPRLETTDSILRRIARALEGNKK